MPRAQPGHLDVFRHAHHRRCVYGEVSKQMWS
jgi:hypothetical protein